MGNTSRTNRYDDTGEAKLNMLNTRRRTVKTKTQGEPNRRETKHGTQGIQEHRIN